MSMDLHNNVEVSRVISPHSPSTTGVIAGQVIDTAGFRSNEFVISTGVSTDNAITVTPIVLSGTATNSLTSASDSDLLGTEAGAALDGNANINSVSKIGYTGVNRYIRCDLDITDAATGLYAVTCFQSDPVKGPVS